MKLIGEKKGIIRKSRKHALKGDNHIGLNHLKEGNPWKSRDILEERKSLLKTERLALFRDKGLGGNGQIGERAHRHHNVISLRIRGKSQHPCGSFGQDALPFHQGWRLNRAKLIHDQNGFYDRNDVRS